MAGCQTAAIMLKKKKKTTLQLTLCKLVARPWKQTKDPLFLSVSESASP